MGMSATAATRSVLWAVIVGKVIEMLAIKEIDDGTAGRNKQSCAQYKKQNNFHCDSFAF